MQRKTVVAGILAIILGFGMILVSCGGGSSSSVDSAIVGTWQNNSNEEVVQIRANGTLEISKEGMAQTRGTLTTGSNNNFTWSTTHSRGAGQDKDGNYLEPTAWYTLPELIIIFTDALIAEGGTEHEIAEQIAKLERSHAPMIGTYALSNNGNTLTLTTVIDDSPEIITFTRIN